MRGRFAWTPLLAMLVALRGAPGSAEERSPSPEDVETVIEMMDRDGDGLISRPEFVRHNARPGAFDELDVDGDGVLDANEQKGVTIGPRRAGD